MDDLQPARSGRVLDPGGQRLGTGRVARDGDDERAEAGEPDGDLRAHAGRGTLYYRSTIEGGSYEAGLVEAAVDAVGTWA